MYAKQYPIPLPADYDMEIIRKRVADKGHFLDDREGLGLKAYLIRERGVDGSPVNEYAPFYLWNDTGEMARFLVGGGGFQNIVRDFGRPAVLHWTGVACHAGPARNATPKAASRRLSTLDEDIEREIDALRELAQHEDVHTAALAVDPLHWQLLRFVLWKEAPQETEGERYQVLHLSFPGLGDLPEGPSW
ncbi:DUF4865 family protein [Allokutzneria multivorans]|uniref:DUF4865 family protein n=1 Tax=Allokutzneria multivorans TaxID=1142134 RepID=A0ABP7SGG1_9PSEU